MSSAPISSPSERRSGAPGALFAEHGRNDPRRLWSPRRAGAPRRSTDTFEIQGGDQLVPRPAGPREIGDVRSPRPIAIAQRSSSGPLTQGQEPVLESVPQGWPTRRNAVPVGRAARGGTEPGSPHRVDGTRAQATLLGPPRRRGRTSQARAACPRADRLRPPDLVGATAMESAPNHVSERQLPESLGRRRRGARRRRGVAQARRPRDRLEDAGLVVHRLKRDQPRARLAPASARSRSAGSSRARSPRRRATTRRAPLAAASASATRVTDGCSRRLVTRSPRGWSRRAPANGRARPRLFASVPPDVKTTSRGGSRRGPPTLRAHLRPPLAPRARSRWMLDGLPHVARAASRMASSDVGSGGVVAFQSR